MPSKRMEDALNEQIKHEFASAWAYLAMSAYFDAENLGGFAQWMRQQSREEVMHAMKIVDFLQDREGRVVLQAIGQPQIEFASPLDVFEHALAHEKKISGTINDLYEIALEEKDYPTQVMLQWFIEEQVEEEKTASDIVEQIKMIGDDSSALLLMDQRMAQRQPEDGE